MKNILCSLSLFFAFNTVNAATQDILDIMDLADQVKLAARTSTASDAELQNAKTQLKQTIALLNQTGGGGSGGNNADCINFAYPKYYQSLTSDAATKKAVAACKLIKDLPTAEFLFNKFYQSQGSVDSMDQSAQRSGASKVGKLDMLQFAFNKYYQSLSSNEATIRASDGIDQVPRGNLSCLQSLYSKYYQSLPSAAAMDNAINDCM